MPDHELPFEQSSFPGWAADVDRWEWVATKSSNGTIEGWWKQGACLRCHHQTVVELGLVETDAVDADADADAAAPPTSEVYAQCECQTTHAEGKKGCGAFAMVNGPGNG